MNLFLFLFKINNIQINLERFENEFNSIVEKLIRAVYSNYKLILKEHHMKSYIKM